MLQLTFVKVNSKYKFGMKLILKTLYELFCFNLKSLNTNLPIKNLQFYSFQLVVLLQVDFKLNHKSVKITTLQKKLEKK